MSNMMDKLLSMELSQPETCRKRLKRLGLDLTLRELSYNKIDSIARGEESDVQLVLEGVADPDLRDPAWWRDKLGCATPAEAVKRLFKPGELRQIARALDKLAGFTDAALEDIREEIEKN